MIVSLLVKLVSAEISSLDEVIAKTLWRTRIWRTWDSWWTKPLARCCTHRKMRRKLSYAIANKDMC